MGTPRLEPVSPISLDTVLRCDDAKPVFDLFKPPTGPHSGSQTPYNAQTVFSVPAGARVCKCCNLSQIEHIKSILRQYLIDEALESFAGNYRWLEQVLSTFASLKSPIS